MFKKIAVSLFLLPLMALTAAEWQIADSAIKVAKPGNKIHALAAKELILHLELICGSKLAPSGNGFVFHVGKAAPGGEKAATPTEANYVIDGKNVYFWGYDKVANSLENDKTIWLDSRHTITGTMSAVYNFLEKELGVRWLRPGDEGIVFSPRTAITLADKKSDRWVMSLMMTGVRTYFWRFRRMKEANAAAPEIFRMTEEEVDALQYQDKLYSRRQRHGMHFYFRYGHAFGNWWEKYGKEHPEWFGMDSTGRRGVDKVYRGREKLCLSNPEVIDAIVKEYIAAGRPACFNVCPNDGTPGFCFCKNCLALDTRVKGENFYAHLTDRYLWFWNRLAARLIKERKDVTIITYIYSYYRLPPRREKVEFPDNMLFGMVPNMFDDNVKFFSEWKKAGAKRIFLRPNDLCHGTPMPRGLEKRIYDKFQQARTFNIFGTDYDGGFGNRSIDLECYVAFRMVHDPELSFDEIMNEYCSAFGAAAPEVAEFYAKWREQGEKIIPMVDQWLKERNRYLNDAGQIPGVVNVEITRYYPDEIFNVTDAILEKGLKKSLSPAERRRLEQLAIQNLHARLYRDLISESNKKNNRKLNELEKVSRRLYDFRVQYRKVIGGKLSVSFGGAKGEGAVWRNIAWYRKDILKLKDDPSGIIPLIDTDFSKPGAMRRWKARDGFISHDHMTGTGVSLKTVPGKDTIGLNCRSITLEPGKTYILSGEARIPKGTKAIRFRLVGKSKTLNQYFYYSNGELNKFRWEFTASAGFDKISFYIYTGPGDGTPVVVRSVKLEEKAKASPASLEFSAFKKRPGFINITSQGAAIKTSNTRDDVMGLSRNFQIVPGKSYQLEAECSFSEPGTYVRFRFSGLGRAGNLYARSKDGKPIAFKAKLTVPASFKGKFTGFYICAGPGSGKPVFVRNVKFYEVK